MNRTFLFLFLQVSDFGLARGADFNLEGGSFLSSGQLLRLSNKGYAGYLKSRETERSFF